MGKINGKEIAYDMMIDEQVESILKSISVLESLIVQSGRRKGECEELYDVLKYSWKDILKAARDREGTQIGHSPVHYRNGYNAAMDDVIEYLKVEPLASGHEILRHCEESKVEVPKSGVDMMMLYKRNTARDVRIWKDKGWTNAEIAEYLGISESQVRALGEED